MSKINELIKEKCSAGVNYEKLGNLIDYIQPTKYIVSNTEYNDKYNVPVLTAGQTFLLGYTNENNSIYEASQENPVIIFDDFTTSNHWVDFRFKVKSSAMKILIPKTDNVFKYIYYCMQNIKYTPKEHARQWIQTYSEFEIPIPAKEIQEEIVKILDRFNDLKLELERELEIRKQQYDFWRNKIFGSNINMIPISDLIEDKGYIRGPFGSALVKSDMVLSGIPVYEQQHAIYNNREFRYYITEEKARKLSRFKVKNHDLIISCSGTVGKVSIIKKEDKEGIINQALLILRFNRKIVLPQYVKYYLESYTGYKSITSNTNKAAQVNIASRDAIERIRIPIPTIQKQRDIVKKLNVFEKLITEELPEEIKLREIQYDYYRNKLLIFKEVGD